MTRCGIDWARRVMIGPGRPGMALTFAGKAQRIRVMAERENEDA